MELNHIKYIGADIKWFVIPVLVRRDVREICMAEANYLLGFESEWELPRWGGARNAGRVSR